MNPPNLGTMTQSLLNRSISICLSNSITFAKLKYFREYYKHLNEKMKLKMKD